MSSWSQLHPEGKGENNSEYDKSGDEDDRLRKGSIFISNK